MEKEQDKTARVFRSVSSDRSLSHPMTTCFSFLHVKNRFRASGEAVSSFIPEAAREHIRVRGETCLVGRLVLEVRN